MTNVSRSHNRSFVTCFFVSLMAWVGVSAVFLSGLLEVDDGVHIARTPHWTIVGFAVSFAMGLIFTRWRRGSQKGMIEMRPTRSKKSPAKAGENEADEVRSGESRKSSTGVGTGVIKIFQQVKDSIGEEEALCTAYDHLLSLACEQFQFDAAAAFVMDNEGRLVLTGACNLQFERGDRYVLDTSGVLADVFLQDIPRHVTDPTLIEGKSGGLFARFSAAWLVPIMPQGIPLGLLIFAHNQQIRDFESYFTKLDFVCIAAGWLLESHRKERLAERENRKNAMLIGTSMAISSSLDLEEVSSILVRNLANAFGCSYSYLLLTGRDEHETYVQTYFSEREGELFAPEERFVRIGKMTWLQEVISFGHPVLWEADQINQIPSDDRRALKIANAARLLMAPLKRGSKLTGILVMVEQRSAQRTRLNDEVVDLCAALVAQAAAAIENARLYAVVSDRVAQATTMFEVGQALNSDLDLVPIVERVLSAVCRNLEISSGSFYLKDDQTNELELLSCLGDPARQGWQNRVAVAKVGVVAHVQATGQVVNLGDVAKQHDFPELHGRSGSVLVIPVILNGSVAGVFRFDSEKRFAFGTREEELLKSVANQVAAAIERIRLKQQEKDKTASLSLICRLIKQLSCALDRNQLLEVALRGLVEGFGFDFASVLVIESDGKPRLARQCCQWGNGYEPGQTYGDHPAIMQALAGSSFVLADESQGEQLAGALPGMKSRFSLPLIARNKTLGVLDIQDRRPKAFTSADCSALQTLAEFLAIDMDNINLYGDIVTKAERLLLVDRISQAISGMLVPEQLFAQIVRSLAELTKYQWAALIFPKDDAYEIRSSHLRGRKAGDAVADVPELASLAGQFKWAMESDEAAFYEVAQLALPPEAAQFFHRHNIKWLAICPLKTRGVVRGLTVVGSSSEEGFGPQDSALFLDVSHHLEIALQNAMLYGETKQAYERLHETQEKLIKSEKFKAMGELAAGIVHDFKNILAAIYGRAQLLRLRLQDHGELPLDVLTKGLEVIERSASDGANILSEISEFGKGIIESHFSEIDLGFVLRDVIEMTRGKWEANPEGKKIVLRPELREGLTLRADRPEMIRVFSNLIINACDAIEQVGEIRLRAWRDEHTITVEVEDNGRGMDANTTKRIFDPFFTTKGSKGTGLGLAMAYAIVEKHGGEITVSSTPGCGTTFTVKFPASGPDPLVLVPISVGGISDDAIFRRQLLDLLSPSGSQTLWFSSLRGIDRLLRMKSLDLMFLDLDLAQNQGSTLVKLINTSRPDIMLVVVASPSLAQSFPAPGGANYQLLTKPVGMSTLETILSKAKQRKKDVSHAI